MISRSSSFSPFTTLPRTTPVAYASGSAIVWDGLSSNLRSKNFYEHANVFARLRDFAKGVTTAVFVAVIVAIVDIVQQPGFDLFSVDWGSLIKVILNTAIVIFFAYLAKNYMSDESGKVFGKIG